MDVSTNTEEIFAESFIQLLELEVWAWISRLEKQLLAEI